MPLQIKEMLRAVEDGDLDRVRTMLAAEPALAAAKGDHNVTPLHAAAEKNQAGIAAALLDAGAELEAETTWGMTALEWAANMGSREAGELLIEKGARLNIWSAAGLGRLDRVRSFVSGSGKLKPGSAQTRHRQDSQGNWEMLPPPDSFTDAISDAFYIACRNGHTAVAEYLLNLGADIDFRGFFGGTGLHWAAINGHRETVSFLLANGAKTDIKDEQFEATPLGWATETKQSGIVELLQRHQED